MCFDTWRETASDSKSGSWIALRSLFRRDFSLRDRPGWNDQDASSFFRRIPCFGAFMRSGMNRVVLASSQIHGRVRTRLVMSVVFVGSCSSRSHSIMSRMSPDLIWIEYGDSRSSGMASIVAVSDG